MQIQNNYTIDHDRIEFSKRIYTYIFFKHVHCTIGIKKHTPIYFSTNYPIEMKLVPIIKDYCLLQFHALKLFLGARLHGSSLPNLIFFKVNPQMFQRNCKVHL